MNERVLIALKAAARGLVSGRLREWPLLGAAFRIHGVDISPDAGAIEMRARARAVLAQIGEQSA